MKLATGRWVSGDDFFGREAELKALTALVRDGNHVLLTGQRRMGKTSIARELGRRLENDGWEFVFADVEGATRAEDAIAKIEEKAHRILSSVSLGTKASRMAKKAGTWWQDNISAVSLRGSVKFRDKPGAGNWRRRGGDLLHICAAHKSNVLLVVDELPIFLIRLLDGENGARRVDEFLSWMREALLDLKWGSLVVIFSGSIGLQHLTERLRLTDRINHLRPFPLGAWDRDTSVACFNALAESYDLQVEDDVAWTVYDRLGLGVPQHVQSFFARLRDFARMRGTDRVTKDDVNTVYRTELLGPSGQGDLIHYKTRLKDALDDGGHTMAMEILAEAAIEKVFSVNARRDLERLYIRVFADAPDRIAKALNVLQHDGYLEFHADDGHRFRSSLLRDWWAGDVRGHRASLADRLAERDRRTPR